MFNSIHKFDLNDLFTNQTDLILEFNWSTCC